MAQFLMPAKPRLAICMPMARGAHPMTMHDLLMLEDVRPYHFLDRVGYQVDAARNQMTAQGCALEDVTHFLWIDDDMTFSPDTAKRLLAHDLPIVGGLCHNRRHPFMPILMHTSARGYVYQYDYPEGLVEVDATGSAFLLVKKEVFLAIQEKCNKTTNEGPWTPIGGGTGEDVSFCYRAKKMGYKVFVDTTVKIGHIGEIVVEEDFARRNRQFIAKQWYPPSPAPEGPPVATIIIPTFKQVPDRLLTAVKSALDQTVSVEVIVIDNDPEGSATKDLESIWFEHEGEKHPKNLAIVTNSENGGLWRSLNKGINLMQTDWFCWLSSDDMFYAAKIERQLALMRAANALASCHAYDVMVADGTIHPSVIVPPMWPTMKHQQQLLAQGCYINGLTAMIHRSIFEKVGHFDPTITIASDWEFWNRVGREFFWLPISEVLATRRDYDNASIKYAADPEKRAIWLEEDAAIRVQYTAMLKEGR